MSQTINLRESMVEMKRHLERLSYNKSLQAWIRYEAGDVDSALEYWTEASRNDDDKGLIARRSLAVHYHSKAYDLELENRGSEAVEFWKKALTLWATIFQSHTFRGLLPRFSTVQTNLSLDYAELDAFIEVLSECVLAQNQKVAERAVESEKWDLVGRQIEIIRQAGFPKNIYEPVLDRILQKLSPITHGVIEHASFDEASARSMEDRAVVAEEYFPTKVNGKLATLVAAIWRGKKAAQTLDNTASAWSKIETLHKGRDLDLLDNLSKSGADQNLAYLTQNRLQELAQAACEVEIAHEMSLWRESAKIWDRIQKSGSTRTVLIDAIIQIESQLVHSDRDAARHVCEELCGKYGESLALSKLIEAQTENRRIANENLRLYRQQRLARF